MNQQPTNPSGLVPGATTAETADVARPPRGRRRPSRQSGVGSARPRCRAKNRTALSASNLGSSPWAPALACNDFSVEA